MNYEQRKAHIASMPNKTAADIRARIEMDDWLKRSGSQWDRWPRPVRIAVAIIATLYFGAGLIAPLLWSF